MCRRFDRVRVGRSGPAYRTAPRTAHRTAPRAAGEKPKEHILGELRERSSAKSEMHQLLAHVLRCFLAAAPEREQVGIETWRTHNRQPMKLPCERQREL